MRYESSSRPELERAAADFSVDGILGARERTWRAVEEISRRLVVGMTEEEAYRLALRTLSELGAEKNWHRPYVRFGPNTLKPYGKPSEPGVRLEADGIYFVDIGPVWDGYEGDAGRTFVTGRDGEMARCAEDARLLHGRVRDRWADTGETGEALYRFATESAAGMGWRLGLEEANGHRLSEFPHALYFKGGISELGFRPAAHRWVLEIQIRHPTRAFGAFYEDLLF